MVGSYTSSLVTRAWSYRAAPLTAAPITSCSAPVILSGSHLPLVKEVVARMREAGLVEIPVVVGGIIPPEDAGQLKAAGVAAVYTPKDFQINHIMADLIRIVDTGAAD